MRKFIPILIGVVLVLTMIFTNPTKTEFSDYMEETFKKEYLNSSSSSTMLDGILSNLGGKIVHYVFDGATIRKNYYIFSTYEFKDEDDKFKALGIFDRFIPLTKINK